MVLGGACAGRGSHMHLESFKCTETFDVRREFEMAYSAGTTRSTTTGRRARRKEKGEGRKEKGERKQETGETRSN